MTFWSSFFFLLRKSEHNQNISRINDYKRGVRRKFVAKTIDDIEAIYLERSFKLSERVLGYFFSNKILAHVENNKSGVRSLLFVTSLSI